MNQKTINFSLYKKGLIFRIFSIIVCSLLLGVLVLEPSGITKNSSDTIRGIDLIWLLDVSVSMDAEDFQEETAYISRIVAAKNIMEKYMIAHPENRYGLVVFAGKSRLISPLTSEYGSILTFLSSIDSKTIQTGGTDFKEALSLTADRFQEEDNTPHTIALLSDGGDIEDSVDLKSVKDIFIGKNIQIITIGIGQDAPSPIPIGKSPFGDPVYKKFQGQIVYTSLNKESLKSLAEIGAGYYIDGASSLKDIHKAITKIAHRSYSRTQDSSQDITVLIITALSFAFFLSFLLFPSSFLKSGNAS